jgi:hypothetical protein
MAASLLTQAGRRGIALALALASACASDHRVSPWLEGVRLGDVAPPGNWQEQVDRVRAEIRADAMTVDVQREGTLSDGSPFALFGLSKVDALGRRRHAVRVVTAQAVVLALGPGEDADVSAGNRTRLIVSLVDGGGWQSGTDLNHDGLVDVVVGAPDGTYEIWGVHARGASPYPMRGLVAPTTAMDIDDDGLPDPAGTIRIAGVDPIEPTLTEVLVFAGGVYTADHPTVRAWHERSAGEASAATIDADGGVVARPVVEELRRALESAWHRLRAGQRPDKVLADADAVARKHAPLQEGVAQAWVRWRGKLRDLFPDRER